MYHLSIDIGASGGRHILGWLENGRLSLKEIYRFENGIRSENGVLSWDIDRLFSCVKEGLIRCKREGIIPETVAIDTWGVDYVLLDADKKEILPAVSYRDSRGERGCALVSELISQDDLYARTGIQKQSFNTIYQLYCDKIDGKLDRAAYFLMMPEYLSFRLTGLIRNEYTNATTTGLLNAQKKNWDGELLEKMGIPAKIFSNPVPPATELGRFTSEIEREVGYSSRVLLCPSHDTASAVAACPLDEESVYISSGTWSLIGTEISRPILSPAAQKANFTNEGGVEYRFRFLKNIMGMWLFQSIRKDLGKQYTYDEMMQMAKKSHYTRRIDPTDSAFLAPENMVDAIRTFLGEPNLPLQDVLSCVYHSLAESYRSAIEELEEICGKKIRSIHVVGGGSKDEYLNALTAEYTKKRVFTSLTEATAVGNLISQMMCCEKKTLSQMREVVRNTWKVKEIVL